MNQLQMWLGWLNQQPDACGECDNCHREGKSLWCLPIEINKEYEAHWLYCRDCFRGIVTKASAVRTPIKTRRIS